MKEKLYKPFKKEKQREKESQKDKCVKNGKESREGGLTRTEHSRAVSSCLKRRLDAYKKAREPHRQSHIHARVSNNLFIFTVSYVTSLRPPPSLSLLFSLSFLRRGIILFFYPFSSFFGRLMINSSVNLF